MTLTQDQETAYNRITDWFRGNHSSSFILAGYAGTGKTTLVKEILSSISSPRICLTPTGKAQSVLAKKIEGLDVHCSTVHRAIYKPVNNTTLADLKAQLKLHPNNEALRKEVEQRSKDEDPVFFRRSENCKITPDHFVVVDEASMVTSRMFHDIMITGARVLFIGDHGQLPPVKSKAFFDQHPPDFTMESIVRQAFDNPIIELSFKVRRGEKIPDRIQSGAVTRLPKQDYDPIRWLDNDQIITGKNESRFRINRYLRRANQFLGWWPKVGDKLICVKNDYGLKLINGIMGVAVSDFVYSEETGCLVGDIYIDGEIIKNVVVVKDFFQSNYDPGFESEDFQQDGLACFDYGYGITVHKAQGSEWPSVLIADDGMNRNQPTFRAQWLYTALTRASERVTWLY